jgi:hypothetical protein
MLQYLIQLGAYPMHNALQVAVMRCLIPEVQYFMENYPQLLRLHMYGTKSVLELASMTTRVPQSAQLVKMLLPHFKQIGKLLETAAKHSTYEVLQVLLEQHITEYDTYQDREKWSACVESAVRYCLRRGSYKKLKVLSEFYLKYGSQYRLNASCWYIISKNMRSRKIAPVLEHTQLFLEKHSNS